MKAFHVLAGLPRAGTTLLENILNQNSAIYASSTSHLPLVLASMTSVHTRSSEIKASSINDRDDTFERLRAAMRGYCEGWYRGRKIVFDKSRVWNHHADLLRWIWPDAKILLCVRDLRHIFASVERRHAETAVFDVAENVLEKTAFHRADSMFAPEGIIGQPLNGIEDLMRRRPGNVKLIRYEDLVSDPREMLQSVYEFVELDAFDHDFENIENSAGDVDALYMHKFPHDGCGPVRKPDRDWHRWVSDDIASLIMNKFQAYNEHFRYKLDDHQALDPLPGPTL